MIQIKKQLSEKEIILRSFYNLAERDGPAAMALLVEVNLRWACCESDLDGKRGEKFLKDLFKIAHKEYPNFRKQIIAGLEKEAGLI